MPLKQAKYPDDARRSLVEEEFDDETWEWARKVAPMLTPRQRLRLHKGWRLRWDTNIVGGEDADWLFWLSMNGMQTERGRAVWKALVEAGIEKWPWEEGGRRYNQRGRRSG